MPCGPPLPASRRQRPNKGSSCIRLTFYALNSSAQRPTLSCRRTVPLTIGCICGSGTPRNINELWRWTPSTPQQREVYLIMTYRNSQQSLNKGQKTLNKAVSATHSMPSISALKRRSFTAFSVILLETPSFRAERKKGCPVSWAIPNEASPQPAVRIRQLAVHRNASASGLAFWVSRVPSCMACRLIPPAELPPT